MGVGVREGERVRVTVGLRSRVYFRSCYMYIFGVGAEGDDEQEGGGRGHSEGDVDDHNFDDKY